MSPDPRGGWRVEGGSLALTVGIVAVLGLIPRIFHPWFYYWDDMMRSFVPQWWHLGALLSAGELPLLEPQGWMGGNIVAEGGYGVWSPLNVATFAFAHSIDDLPLIGLVVAIFYLCVLAGATYALAREYGSRRWIAVVIGAAIPFSGYTLFYDATRWPGGLQAFALVTVFWAATRRWARLRTNPLIPMVAGFLAITTGNPYAAVAMIIVLLGVAAELWFAKQRRRILHLLGIGAVAGSAGILMFLPLVLASPVGWRRPNAVGNDGFLVPGLGDILSMSSPTYQPHVQSWWGPIDASPSTYLAYFIVPLLPWLNYRVIAHRFKRLSSLLIIGSVFVLLSVGMSSFGMFRWPIRLIEYGYLAIAVVFAVVASAGFVRTHLRRRIIGTGAILLVGLYLSVSQSPQRYRWHLVAAVVVAVLIFAALQFEGRSLRIYAAGTLIAGIGIVLAMQGWVFMRSHPAAPSDVPLSARQLQIAGREYQGTTLMLWDPSTARPDVVRSGRLLDGNWLAVAAPATGMNRYTGIGFTAFSDALCMDYRGGVCPEAWEQLWRKVPEAPNVSLADALGIRTIVVATTYKKITHEDLPSGWNLVESATDRTVLRRSGTAMPGTVSAATTGIEILHDDLSTDRLTERIDVTSGGGRLVLSRLNWPGYSVLVDGHPVTTRTGTAGLLEIPIGAGHHTVEVTFRTPGVAVGLAVLGIGVLGGAALSIAHLVMSRRRQRQIKFRSS